MENLKKIRDGFAKIPQQLIHILVIISCVYVNIPALFSAEVSLTLAELDLASLGVTEGRMKIMIFILTVLVLWAIVEIGIAVVLNLASRGRYIIPEKTRLLKNTARLGYIITNLVIGSYNLTEFISNEVVRLHFNYAANTVNLVVNCVVFTFVFLVLKKDVIKEDRVFSFYSALFRIYAIFQSVSRIYTMIDILVPSDVIYTQADMVFSIINVVIVAAQLTLLYFFVYKKTKKEQIESMAKIQVEVAINNKDNDIFTGYDL